MSGLGAPLGAVLAGGKGTRLGGRKATASVLGRPLLHWTLAAVRQAVDEVVVIAKPQTELPPSDAPVWRSEPEDFHPRHGLVSALRGAAGRPVVVVPVDMPLVPAALLEWLLELVREGAPAAIPVADGHMQPLCAVYGPGALDVLAGAPADEPLKRTLDRLGAEMVEAGATGGRLLNINTPEDIVRCEELLGGHDPMVDSWDAAAEDWIAWSRSYDHDHLFWRLGLPALLDLLPAPGRLTVDVGCGEGRVARELARIGHPVIGIDASERLAAAARTASPPTQVLVADAAAMPLSDGEADLAVACMSLLNFENLDGVVGEVARVLAPEGRFAFSLRHPMTTADGGDYFLERRISEHREREGLDMTFHDIHRPLTALVSALVRAGLVLETLREPVPDDAHVAAHPDAERWRRRPALLLGRAVRPA